MTISSHQREGHDAITPIPAAVPARDLELVPIPLQPTKNKGTDPFLVAFNTPHDPLNPRDWPTSRKWAVTDVLSATGFNRIMVSTIMAPALSTIAKEFDMNSAESAMALSIYLLATAFGPLVIGPLSEVYGRKPILHASNIWFLVWNMVCGFANSKEVLIASRFLAGFGASAIYALASGVLGDVWRPEQRGRSLGVYLLIPLLGAAVGPIIGGFMAARTTWRWMFWATSIFQAAMILVSATVFKETYEPAILRARAKQLRRETNDARYHTADEHPQGLKSAIATISRALTRPLRLLAFHPIIQITAVLEALSYGTLYIVLSTFSDLWVKQYNQSVEISGLHYIACAGGEVIGSQICARVMDGYYRRRQTLSSTSPNPMIPEHRLPPLIPGTLLAPLGLILYGFTAQAKLHWAIVDAGMVIAMAGMQWAGMPIQAYVIDAYPSHVSSATAATQFLRSLTAFLFPLFAPRMYEVMGYGWGNGFVAGVGMLFGVLGPLVLWVWGEGLRGRAGRIL
ncbi:major facilitator superfamily domain-containing protein [Aspergillus karnatakaensis]|uniref:MFS transporter n=1 Tax=Aspergillus karnatakaensis TaxID=1810916 RepID=UPI003CCD4846